MTTATLIKKKLIMVVAYSFRVSIIIMMGNMEACRQTVRELRALDQKTAGSPLTVTLGEA